jgi:hypothetical protein
VEESAFAIAVAVVLASAPALFFAFALAFDRHCTCLLFVIALAFLFVIALAFLFVIALAFCLSFRSAAEESAVCVGKQSCPRREHVSNLETIA